MAAAASISKRTGTIRNKVFSAAVSLVESNPYAWKLAWEAAHLPFLLPHDRSYRAFRHFIKAAPAGLFLDIGANDGISALGFRKFDRAYRILSLEPNGMLEPRLKKIAARDAKFEYKMLGAGSESGRIQFFVPIYRGIVLHTYTSSRRDRVEEAIASVCGKSVLASTVIKTVESDVIRGDELNVDPTIIKIDAEGFDYEVLRGLDATIARARPFLVMEYASREEDRSAQYLRAQDYVTLTYDISEDRFAAAIESPDQRIAMGRHPEPGQRNFFAVPRQKLGTIPI
jgi:FkbM family methyltransferase